VLEEGPKSILRHWHFATRFATSFKEDAYATLPAPRCSIGFQPVFTAPHATRNSFPGAFAGQAPYTTATGTDTHTNSSSQPRRNISCISFRFRRGRGRSGRLSTLSRESGRVSLLILKTRAWCWNRVVPKALSIVPSTKCSELCL
jgi:hypothetical protein